MSITAPLDFFSNLNLSLKGVELGGYFSSNIPLLDKSIQRSWNFGVSFVDNPFNVAGNRIDTGPMPILMPWHIKSIVLPTYKFSKEIMVFGQVPVTFPVLDITGFEIEVLMEEDEYGTIDFFINWCQRQIIDKDGYYIPPLQNRVGHIIVEVTDPKGIPVIYYTFRDIYYLGASTISYDYDTNESIKRSITFGVDRVENIYTKYTLINGVQGLVTQLPQVLNSLGSVPPGSQPAVRNFPGVPSRRT